MLLTGTATHGLWCRSRTWPMRCRDCSDPVFFFSCDCGSKVLFDELGPPWPEHDCDRSWGKSLDKVVTAEGDLVVEITDGVTAVRHGRRRDDIALHEVVRHSITTLGFDHPIERMDPYPGVTEPITGILRELRLQVDPRTSLGLPDTDVALAALGPAGQEPVGRITVHVPSPEIPDVLESFTVWVPTHTLTGLRRGATVSLIVKGRAVMGAEPIWFAGTVGRH